MVGLWFTYCADALPLVQSVAQFREVFPGAAVAFADDAFCPLPQATVAEVLPDILVSTTFDRGGSLCGWPCVRGMLQTMFQVCHTAGSSEMFKVDCDTLLRGSRWTRETGLGGPFDMSGVVGHYFYAMGMSYRISITGVARALERLRDKDPMTGAAVPEDRAISSLLADRLHLEGWASGVAGAWAYRGGNHENFSKAQVVTFGNRRDRLPGEFRDMGPGYPRKSASEISGAMQRFRETYPAHGV